MSEVLGLGFVATGFTGSTGTSDSGAVTSQCGVTYHLLGGAYLSGASAKIERIFTGL